MKIRKLTLSWHKKLPELFRGMTSKNNGDFDCLKGL